jgi:serine/threonine-protein kinase HipA
VRRAIEVVDRWRDHFAAIGVTPSDLETLAQSIDGEVLLAQRRAFDPARHATAKRPTRRRGPFAG